MPSRTRARANIHSVALWVLIGSVVWLSALPSRAHALDSLREQHPQFASLIQATPIPLPRQGENFSPQGIALWHAHPDQAVLLVSKKKPQHPSLLSLFDPSSGAALGRFTILDQNGQQQATGVGGIAVYHDHVLLVSNQGGHGFIGVVPGDRLRASLAEPQAAPLQPLWIPINQRASASGLHGSHLWVIAFVKADHPLFSFDEHSRWQQDGIIRPLGSAFSIADLLAWQHGQPPPRPVAQAGWPTLMQGAAIIGEDLWVARSWSTQHRHLERYPLANLIAGHVDRDAPSRSISVPAYIEGLWATTEGQLWIAFEGGTPARVRRLARAGLHAETRAIVIDPRGSDSDPEERPAP